MATPEKRPIVSPPASSLSISTPSTSRGQGQRDAIVRFENYKTTVTPVTSPPGSSPKTESATGATIETASNRVFDDGDGNACCGRRGGGEDGDSVLHGLMRHRNRQRRGRLAVCTSAALFGLAVFIYIAKVAGRAIVRNHSVNARGSIDVDEILQRIAMNKAGVRFENSEDNGVVAFFEKPDIDVPHGVRSRDQFSAADGSSLIAITDDGSGDDAMDPFDDINDTTASFEAATATTIRNKFDRVRAIVANRRRNRRRASDNERSDEKKGGMDRDGDLGNVPLIGAIDGNNKIAAADDVINGALGGRRRVINVTRSDSSGGGGYYDDVAIRRLLSYRETFLRLSHAWLLFVAQCVLSIGLYHGLHVFSWTRNLGAQLQLCLSNVTALGLSILVSTAVATSAAANP